MLLGFGTVTNQRPTVMPATFEYILKNSWNVMEAPVLVSCLTETFSLASSACQVPCRVAVQDEYLLEIATFKLFFQLFLRCLGSLALPTYGNIHNGLSTVIRLLLISVSSHGP